ncbi:ABC transporter permease, partial [Candidatus Aerophobetes bacterium]|nr:ABC transporter permease [Candidatus Aerophobetes bacterium]
MSKKKDKKFLPFLRSISVYLIAILRAFGVFSLLIAIMGFDIFRALRTLTTTSFKSYFGFQETIKKTIPLIFTT